MTEVCDKEFFIYDEMLIHPAFFLAKKSSKVMLYSNAASMVYEEILKHEEVETLHVVNYCTYKLLKDKYDLIFIDTHTSSIELINRSFLENIHNLQDDYGITVISVPSIIKYYEPIKNIFDILSEKFNICRVYNSHGYYYLYCSKLIHPLMDYNPLKLESHLIRYNYYNSEMHVSAFSESNYIKTRFMKVE